MSTRMRALLAAVLLAAAPAKAQIDDAKRLFLAGGYEDAVGNLGPSAPYGFLYLNRPGAAGPGSAFRLALAPVYADAELGLPSLFGSRTDLGLGLSGGGYAFGHAEIRRGDEKPGEDFIGHGGGPSASLYPRLGDIGPAPLNGVLRVSAVYTDYQRTARTAALFEPPPDEWTGAARAGLRLGGVEPGMDRGRAAEASVWAETRLRDRPASYGYNGDRYVRRNVNLYWARVLLSLPTPGGVHASGGLNAGGGGGVGRLSAYTLGGMLTQTSEFPLILPGYFGQEISASRYVHAWAHAGVPIRGSKSFLVNFTAAVANVKPVYGTDPGGIHHAGLAAGLSFEPAEGFLRADLTYGYAPTALRGAHRGAQSLAFNFEYDFLAPANLPEPLSRTRQQGLRWLFGR
ncbi:MAG: hypothetical protein ABL955_01440 [Elusimicrobiota bacterium]